MEKLNISSWSIWEKEVSRFPWTYDDTEECYILEGKVTVEANGKEYKIEVGDFVSFPKGLNCVWDISEDLRKHYRFL